MNNLIIGTVIIADNGRLAVKFNAGKWAFIPENFLSPIGTPLLVSFAEGDQFATPVSLNDVFVAPLAIEVEVSDGCCTDVSAKDAHGNAVDFQYEVIDLDVQDE